MRINKFTAIAILAIGATGITAGTAYAAPAQTNPVHSQVTNQVNGVDHGISYNSQISADGKSLVTTVTKGTFAMTPDKKSVAISDASGKQIGLVPTGVSIDGHTLTTLPTIDRSGTRLTLTPVAAHIRNLRDINSQQWFAGELQHASLGGIVGAVIGFLVGFFGILGIGAIPGAVIGGIIGLLVAGGWPLINSGVAYFSGH